VARKISAHRPAVGKSIKSETAGKTGNLNVEVAILGREVIEGGNLSVQTAMGVVDEGRVSDHWETGFNK